jgi:hypothetical protein
LSRTRGSFGVEVSRETSIPMEQFQGRLARFKGTVFPYLASKDGIQKVSYLDLVKAQGQFEVLISMINLLANLKTQLPGL